MKEEVICKYCNKPFTRVRKDNIYCTPTCCGNHRYHRVRKVKYDNRLCKQCNTSFKPTRKDNVFCSLKCGSTYSHIKNKLKYDETKKDYYQKNLTGFRERMLKREYNLSINDYEKLLSDQNGNCKICGLPETSMNKYGVKNLAVDHCHTTGRVRGLLCSRCNRGLGYFKDDKVLLKKAIKYLEV